MVLETKPLYLFYNTKLKQIFFLYSSSNYAKN